MDKLNSFGSNFFGFLEHTTNLLTEGLTKLAEQAGVLLTHLWVIFTRQQLILGLQEFISGLAFTIAAGFAYKTLLKVNKNKKLADMDKGALQFIFFVATITLVTIGFNHIIGSLPRLINPEYYALQESVRLLKEVKP